MFCVDKLKYEHLAILSDLKSCQFAPKIMIFNLYVCCQFEDLQIILPKISLMSHHNIELWQMRANFLQEMFLFLLVHNSEFLEKLIIKRIIVSECILVRSRAEWVNS